MTIDSDSGQGYVHQISVQSLVKFMVFLFKTTLVDPLTNRMQEPSLELYHRSV